MFEDDYDNHFSGGSYMTDAVRQYAYVYGEEDVDSEWILSPFDTWERNPHYRGEPGRHPEDYDYE